jgi:hypothetical protein
MLDEIEKAPRAGGAFSELPCMTALAIRKLSRPRENTQIKFQGRAEGASIWAEAFK